MEKNLHPKKVEGVDPQLHLFETPKQDIVGEPIPPAKEIRSLEDQAKYIIQKYKLGVESIPKLRCVESELDVDHEMKGWYVGEKTLEKWNEDWEQNEETDKNLPYWQK